MQAPADSEKAGAKPYDHAKQTAVVGMPSALPASIPASVNAAPVGHTQLTSCHVSCL